VPRSLKKGPFVDESLLRKVKKTKGRETRRIIFTDEVGARGNDFQGHLMIVNVNQRLNGGGLMQLMGRGGRQDQKRGGTYDVAWVDIVDKDVLSAMVDDFFRMRTQIMSFLYGNPYFQGDTITLFAEIANLLDDAQWKGLEGSARLTRIAEAKKKVLDMLKDNAEKGIVFSAEWNLIHEKHQAMRRLWSAGLMYTVLTQFVIKALQQARQTENPALIEHLEALNNKLFAREGNTSSTEDVWNSSQPLDALTTAATRDFLTGLLNRRSFFDIAKRIVSTCRRSKSDYAVAIIDIDHFKIVNDTYGHDAGDDVLKSIAKTIERHTKRGGDLCARHGGEEFAIMMEVENAKNIGPYFEKLRAAIESCVVKFEGREIKVTASFGVVISNELELDAMITAADENLYKAKNDGRNRVVIN